MNKMWPKTLIAYMAPLFSSSKTLNYIVNSFTSFSALLLDVSVSFTYTARTESSVSQTAPFLVPSTPMVTPRPLLLTQLIY